jgi:hypothetical protein
MDADKREWQEEEEGNRRRAPMKDNESRLQMRRNPNQQEYGLLKALVYQNNNIKFDPAILAEITVEVMDDGGMGSLLLFLPGGDGKKRLFGSKISEINFKDTDGVEVIATLNVDKEGQLFELDIWKTDFSRLIEIPNL